MSHRIDALIKVLSKASGAGTRSESELRELIEQTLELELTERLSSAYYSPSSEAEATTTMDSVAHEPGRSPDTDTFLWDQYKSFAARGLEGYPIIYLFLEGIDQSVHPGYQRQAVLCSWGITSDGGKALLHLSPGSRDDIGSCETFLRDQQRRGLREPSLAITDGSVALTRAVEACFPHSRHQRSITHRMRDLKALVPSTEWPEFRERASACYHAPSPAVAALLRDRFVAEQGSRWPQAMSCFLEDFDACIAHQEFPVAHRRSIRSTHLIERLIDKRQLRMLAAGAVDEHALLKHLYVELRQDSQRWRGLRMHPANIQHLASSDR
jgi:transposase-like protein